MKRFRGGFPATIDGKGRVKLPARHRDALGGEAGGEVYVCSFFPHELRVYPLAVWESLEERLLSKPTMNKAVLKLIERVNYGQLVEMDPHGRIVVPSLLRDMIDVDGEVVISGRINHLAITRRERAATILKEDSLSDEELTDLAALDL